MEFSRNIKYSWHIVQWVGSNYARRTPEAVLNHKLKYVNKWDPKYKSNGN